MANDRIRIRCKHCGESVPLAKYYPGSLSGVLHSDRISDFLVEHFDNCCWNNNCDQTLGGDPRFELTTESDVKESQMNQLEIEDLEPGNTYLFVSTFCGEDEVRVYLVKYVNPPFMILSEEDGGNPCIFTKQKIKGIYEVPEGFLKALNPEPTQKMIIEIEGGMVVQVYCDNRYDVEIVDWDNTEDGDPQKAEEFKEHYKEVMRDACWMKNLL